MTKGQGIINGGFSSIFHPNMGTKCAEDPFNIGQVHDLGTRPLKFNTK